jgi:uncharacterized protein (TIGR00251 family)
MFESNKVYQIKVKPNSSRSEIHIEEDMIIVFLKSIPQDDKANLELVKLFKKNLKLKIEIISGLKSKNKKIKIV